LIRQRPDSTLEPPTLRFLFFFKLEVFRLSPWNALPFFSPRHLFREGAAFFQASSRPVSTNGCGLNEDRALPHGESISLEESSSDALLHLPFPRIDSGSCDRGVEKPSPRALPSPTGVSKTIVNGSRLSQRFPPFVGRS